MQWSADRNARMAESRQKRREAQEQKAASKAAEASRRRARAALELACKRAALTNSPSPQDVEALEKAIVEAEAERLDDLTIINPARRRLRELVAQAEAAERGVARSQLSDTLMAIEQRGVAVKGKHEAKVRGAAALLCYVYERHPPKKPSYALDKLKALDGDGEMKKILLGAQRDYHPDRNEGMVRETLNYSPQEWEVVCLTICQQLALAYDKVYKAQRSLSWKSWKG